MPPPPPELLCVSCGYNLHGLPDEGACPECGVPINSSRSGDRLADADRDWLRRIVGGQRLVTWGLRGLVLATVAAVLVPLVQLTLWAHLDVPVSRFKQAGWLTVFVAAIIGVLLLAAGAWLVTSQEPREVDRESILSARRLARWAPLAAIILIVVAMGLDQWTPPTSLRSITLLIPTYLAISVGLVATLRRLAALTRRIPDLDLSRKLSSSARFFTWALPFMVISTFATSAGMRWPGITPSSVIVTAISLGGTIVIFLMLVNFVLLAILMFTCHRALAGALRESIWRKHENV